MCWWACQAAFCDLDDLLTSLVPATESTMLSHDVVVLVGSCTGAVLAAALAEALHPAATPRALVALGSVAPHLRAAEPAAGCRPVLPTAGRPPSKVVGHPILAL